MHRAPPDAAPSGFGGGVLAFSSVVVSNGSSQCQRWRLAWLSSSRPSSKPASSLAHHSLGPLHCIGGSDAALCPGGCLEHLLLYVLFGNNRQVVTRCLDVYRSFADRRHV
eukprot:8465621-Alexandrium_andersonii.AAC.1